MVSAGDAVARRLGRCWQAILPGVVDIDRDGLTLDRRLVAGLLYAGDGAALAGATAARWYGVKCLPEAVPVQLLVPAARASRSTGFAGRLGTAIGVRPTVAVMAAIARSAEAMFLVSPFRVMVDLPEPARR